MPVIAAGNDFDRVRLRLGQLAGATRPTRSPSRRRPTPTTIADFSSAGPDAGLAAAEARRQRPGRRDHLVAARRPGRPVGRARTGRAWRRPHVAGGAALLQAAPPDWTVAQIKSALVQTGDPVHDRRRPRGLGAARGRRADRPRPRADNPLLFAAPTVDLVPGERRRRARSSLTDAGGGAGRVVGRRSRCRARTPASRSTAPADASPCPGSSRSTATVAPSARNGDVTGFVDPHARQPTRAGSRSGSRSTTRVLGRSARSPLTQPGHLQRHDDGRRRRSVSRYRYPTGGDTSYPGPEVVYRVTITKPVANFGVAVALRPARSRTSSSRATRTTSSATRACPIDLNPYFDTFGESRAGRRRRPARCRAPTTSSSTRGPRRCAGPFTFRYWVNDTTPPTAAARCRARPRNGRGLDHRRRLGRRPALDPAHRRRPHRRRCATRTAGAVVRSRPPAAHSWSSPASDYQEAKNMEDVAKIKPNTATLERTVIVRKGRPTA